MRNLILFNVVTLDGFFKGPKGELDWHNVNEEFNFFAEEQLRSVDAFVFGRITYQLMADYWTTETALKNDPIIAGLMNQKTKYVFSKTLDRVEWNNSRLFKTNLENEIQRLKREPGKDLITMGSSNLSLTLIRLGLIDEFRIMINPLFLGSGIPLFQGLQERLRLKLLNKKTFDSGNVLLCYQPDPTHR